jgi:hypothetical protein
LIDTRISKNDTLVSLISHVNWSAGWKLLTALIKHSNSTWEHDAVPRQSSMYSTYHGNQGWRRPGRFFRIYNLKNVLVRDGGLIVKMRFQTQSSEKGFSICVNWKKVKGSAAGNKFETLREVRSLRVGPPVELVWL